MPKPVSGIKIMGEEEGGLPTGQVVVVSVGPVPFITTTPLRSALHIIPTLQQGKLRLTAAGRGRTGHQFNLSTGAFNHCPLNMFSETSNYQAFRRLSPEFLRFDD